ncbi:MAG: penicillin-binding transpeptidase domain-containing protein, partial [Dehalococcoidia bacterium]
FRVQLIPGELPSDPHERRLALVRLEEVTGVSYADLEAAAGSTLALVDPFAPVLVLDGLKAEEAIALQAALAGQAGARVAASPSRVYATEDSLAHILGHVGDIPEDEADALTAQGYPLDGTIGLAGVESVYEDSLRGLPGRRLILSDPQGREVEMLAEFSAEPGADVVLSIDLDLQRAATAALADGIARGLSVVRTGTGQQRDAPIPVGAALVMDVRTGELLASVSLPSYDPNLFLDGDPTAIAKVFTDPARPLIDRTYMETRSPGSTFKPLVALAALEEGIATADTRINSTGAITIRDEYDPSVVYVFRDWAAHGNTNMKEALARSSDVYFYLLAGGYHGGGGQAEFEGMGADTLAKWARNAGFGSPTGFDLPGEVGGLVPDRAWKKAEFDVPWVLGDTYPFGIGQGYLTVTPLQMTVLTAAIANGGTLLEPRVVHGFRTGGATQTLPVTNTRRLDASPSSFQTVREGMLGAASTGGTAITGRPEGIAIGGKTGTAEFGQDYPDGQYDTHAWYIGFAPYDEPEIAVVVYLEYGVGSTHAGPVARAIMEAYFALQDGAAGDRVATTDGARP